MRSFDQKYNAIPAVGWVKPERAVTSDQPGDLAVLEPDIPRAFSPRYPSGYIVPFHYKHPVTGKETTEGAHNTSVKGVTS